MNVDAGPSECATPPTTRVGALSPTLPRGRRRGGCLVAGRGSFVMVRPARARASRSAHERVERRAGSPSAPGSRGRLRARRASSSGLRARARWRGLRVCSPGARRCLCWSRRWRLPCARPATPDPVRMLAQCVQRRSESSRIESLSAHRGTPTIRCQKVTVTPPSTVSTWPVTYVFLSDASHATCWAISAGIA